MVMSSISRPVRQTYHGYPGTPGPIAPAGMSIAPSPLAMTARWNRPAEAGEVRCPAMADAPKDTPATVTLPGSPPKARAFLRTQARAARWSCRPKVPEPSSPGRASPPKTPSR